MWNGMIPVIPRTFMMKDLSDNFAHSILYSVAFFMLQNRYDTHALNGFVIHVCSACNATTDSFEKIFKMLCFYKDVQR